MFTSNYTYILFYGFYVLNLAECCNKSTGHMVSHGDSSDNDARHREREEREIRKGKKKNAIDEGRNSKKTLVSHNYILYDCYIIWKICIYLQRVTFIILITTFCSMFYIAKNLDKKTTSFIKTTKKKTRKFDGS
jgi:hypothetical protein